ncbi:MAG TPA: type II secretion system protein N [Burkholderiales bacterium]|jgi:general secretion pathway protein N|nr:type II secretion system protein N [Burkholderiales bacterium]
MKRRHLIAIGLFVYVVAAIATAPARLVDSGLQRASNGRLRLVEAQGTLWSGSGQIEIRDTGGRTGVAKSLAWRVVPESLLRGRLVCEVQLDQSTKRFPVTISLSRIELANADISLPAAVLGLGVPKLAPLGLTGDVLIHVASLSIARNEMEGNATLQWRAAGSTLTPVSPLGDYEIRLDGEGMMLHAFLRTISGPLRLDGKGSWTHGDSPAFLAMARVLPPHQQQLAPLLRQIAVERGEGSFELQLN